MLMKDSRKVKELMALNGVAAAVLLITFGHVMVHYSAYVYKFQSMSLFDGSWSWFASHFDRPGALILYLGRFLTQFCICPAAAAALLFLVFAGIVFLICRMFVKDARFAVLALFTPLALFLFIMNMGYEVLTARADAQIFTQPLGVLAALVTAWVCTCCSRREKIVPAVPVLAVVVLYPLFGFFALLGAMAFGLHCIFSMKGSARAIAPAVSLASSAAVPYLYYLLCYNHTPLKYMWQAGTPYLDFGGVPVPAAWLAMAFVSVLLFALPPFRKTDRTSRLSFILPVTLTAAMVAAVYTLPDRRLLLHRQMEVEYAMGEGDWETVAKITTSLRTTNDVLVAYRNSALYFLGRLPQDCWKYSFSTVPVTSGTNTYVSSRVAGPTIFFYSGLINYAARWASEINLYGSYSVERVKYLAKTALFNGETELARKYIDMVGRTTFQKRWARKYLEYLDNPSMLADDPEYKMLAPLQEYQESGWYPSDVAAYDVLLFYAFVKGDSVQMLEWNLAAAQLTKSAQYFNEIYADYSRLAADVPVEVAQTASFFSSASMALPASAERGKYSYFYHNENILRPN